METVEAWEVSNQNSKCPLNGQFAHVMDTKVSTKWTTVCHHGFWTMKMASE